MTYVQLLIEERAYRQENVIREINDKWGDPVYVYGPILKVPFYTYSESSTYNETTKTYSKETKKILNKAYIFPNKLNINSKVNSKELYLGNFESVVYTTDLQIVGSFSPVDLSAKDIKPQDVLWDKISLVYNTSNLKGIKTEMEVKLNGTSHALESNSISNNKHSYKTEQLETSSLDKETTQKNISFAIDATYDGSRQIQFIPIGKITKVVMNSNWPNPSFIGNYSPNDDTRTITEDGFSANWTVLSINRAFAQTYLNTLPNLHEFAFGTKFIILADEYQQSERSAKYGFLVIGLTFLLFFLIQTLSKIPIHPFQYLMIGLALIMFYTLLVSISEHSNFSTAYLIAGSSVIVLIALYSKAIVKSTKLPIFISLSLSVLYGFIYVIIQLENYALLVGSIGLFAILATVMFVSRKIDWNNG